MRFSASAFAPIVAVASILLGACDAFQDPVYTGRIVDARTGQPLRASVAIHDTIVQFATFPFITEEVRTRGKASTDADGNFRVSVTEIPTRGSVAAYVADAEVCYKGNVWPLSGRKKALGTLGLHRVGTVRIDLSGVARGDTLLLQRPAGWERFNPWLPSVVALSPSVPDGWVKVEYFEAPGDTTVTLTWRFSPRSARQGEGTTTVSLRSCETKTVRLV